MMRQPRAHVAAWMAALCVLCVVWPGPVLGADDGEAASGQLLYEGLVPLEGRLRGHTEPLPLHALRCANCHEPSPQPNQTDAALAPRLDRTYLLESQRRRGGPPSRYDVSAFCHLLRTSVDPASILVAKVMPQYAISAADCHSLWLYLSRRDPVVPKSSP
jgi:hypothetical protein